MNFRSSPIFKGDDDELLSTLSIIIDNSTSSTGLGGFSLFNFNVFSIPDTSFNNSEIFGN